MIAAEKSRTVRLSHDPLAITIRETVRDKVTVETYYLAPITGGFRLTKSDRTVYDVFLVGTASCGCLGHRHYGHKPGFACRHVASLRAEIARGNLAEPACSECNGMGGPQTGDADSDGSACRSCGE